MRNKSVQTKPYPAILIPNLLTQSNVSVCRPTGNLARDGLHDDLISFPGLQVLELPFALVVPVPGDGGQPFVAPQRYLILVEFGHSLGRVPEDAERGGRYRGLVEGDVEGPQRHRSILSRGRGRGLVLGHRLNRNIVSPACARRMKHAMLKLEIRKKRREGIF